MKNKIIFFVNILAVALIAVLVKQVGHESFHGISANLVGATWTKLNLFYAESIWQGEPSQTGNIIISGSAAIVNILLCFLFAFLFNSKAALQNPTLRLFFFFLTAYNLFAGFGYLFIDPLLYQSGGQNLGDWKYIVHALGGGWNVRLPISLIGAAGVLWGFFWVAQNAHAFLPAEQPQRFRQALILLLSPYLILSTLFTILASLGYLPADVAIIIAIQYFFGYFGIGWGAFMAGLWIKPKATLQRTPLPESLQVGWVITALVLFSATVIILLPTLTLG